MLNIQTGNFKVFVKCTTFNHAPYIEDTLKGFAIQKTDFPFVCLVIDDASTDNEQDVIKAWMNRECNIEKAEYYEDENTNTVIVPHKTNSSCTFAFYFLKRNLYREPATKILYYKYWRSICEYEALCEGDDYWIAEDKLQMQVNLLDTDKGIVLVRTDADVLNQETGSVKKSVFKNGYFPNCKDSFIDYVVSPQWLATCSWMYRMSVVEYTKIPDDCFKGDLALMIYAAKNGKVKYINDTTSVYRMLNNSASHFQNTEKEIEFWRSQVNTRCYYAKNLKTKSKCILWTKLLHLGRHYYIANRTSKPLRFISYFLFAIDTFKRIMY